MPLESASNKPLRASCVLADLATPYDAPELMGPAATAWQLENMGRVLFDSPEVVETAGHEPAWVPGPGLYFLVWHGKVCYVGQSNCVGMRLNAHFREGRPHDGAAVIAGLPRWALTEFEHAYIEAWSPPWNDETTRKGRLYLMPELSAAAKALDSSAVMPHYVPRIKGSVYGRKQWQLQVLGYQQAHP